jgi:hypothetical protein
LRDSLRRVGELALVVFVTLAAFGLGFEGFARVQGSASTLDLVYLSLQLFVLQSGALPAGTPVPWTLDVARFLAPGVAAYATLRVLAGVLRDQIDGVFAAVFRHHDIVCGTSDVAVRLALGLRQDGRRVVVIAGEADAAIVTRLRRAGARVINGDAGDAAAFRRAGIARADRVVVAAGADTDNARFTMTMRQAAEGRPRAELVCFVLIEQIRLCQLLRADHLMSGDHRVRLEFVNLTESAVLALLDAHPPGPGLNAVAGGSAIAAELASQLATAIGATRVARLDTGARPPSGAGTIYVSEDNDDAAVKAALALHWEAPADASIVVVQTGPSGVADLLSVATERKTYTNVKVFSVLDRTFRPATLLHDVAMDFARALHADYVATHVSDAGADRRLLKDWDDLDDDLQRSNLRRAAGTGRVLERHAFAIVPASVSASTFEFTPGEVEKLAEAEHERWRHERHGEGWRHGPGRNPMTKTHPLLKPWRDLSEDEREQNRVQIRSLPSLLRAQRLSIVRRTPSDARPGQPRP